MELMQIIAHHFDANANSEKVCTVLGGNCAVATRGFDFADEFLFITNILVGTYFDAFSI